MTPTPTPPGGGEELRKRDIWLLIPLAFICAYFLCWLMAWIGWIPADFFNAVKRFVEAI